LFAGSAVTAVGGPTTVAITGSSREIAKGRATPSWTRNADRVVDPAVKLSQFTVAPPAADWNTWVLSKGDDETDDDVEKLA
jgi:hypothetical protein